MFVALFASADAVFARLTSDVLAWQPDVDLEDLLVRAVVVTVVAWGAAGLLGLAAGLLPAYAAAPALPRPEPVAARTHADHAATPSHADRRRRDRATTPTRPRVVRATPPARARCRAGRRRLVRARGIVPAR